MNGDEGVDFIKEPVAFEMASKHQLELGIAI